MRTDGVAIDGVARVCHIYKDVWSAEMGSELPYHALHSQQSCRPVRH